MAKPKLVYAWMKKKRGKNGKDDDNNEGNEGKRAAPNKCLFSKAFCF